VLARISGSGLRRNPLSREGEGWGEGKDLTAPHIMCQDLLTYG
jgi:hypothetical protein